MTYVRIRQAESADLNALVGLLQILFAIEEDFDFDAARQRRGLELILSHDGAVLLVAEAEGRVIGMCSGQLTLSTAEGGHSLLVEDVVVTTNWQGHGVGKKLMHAMEQWARARKVQRLQLLADRNNQAALEFYTTIGWQNTALVLLRRRLPV